MSPTDLVLTKIAKLKTPKRCDVVTHPTVFLQNQSRRSKSVFRTNMGTDHNTSDDVGQRLGRRKRSCNR